MSGECEKCSEHCLDCDCVKNIIQLHSQAEYEIQSQQKEDLMDKDGLDRLSHNIHKLMNTEIKDFCMTDALSAISYYMISICSVARMSEKDFHTLMDFFKTSYTRLLKDTRPQSNQSDDFPNLSAGEKNK